MKKVIMPFGLFMQDPSMLQKPEITVRNKRGEKVRIVCVDANIPDYPVVGIVEVDKNDPAGDYTNYAETYTKEGRFTTESESDEDLEVEVDNDAIIRRFGVDPLAAASIASVVFGDPKQYLQEELNVISRLVLATTAFAAM
jgi:hypothetical protein